MVHCVNLVSGREDSVKVRAEEKIRRRFKGSWVTDSTQSILPPAPFSLSKEDIELADTRAKRVFVPSGFDWRPRNVFGRTSGMSMKSHEWKQLATNGILKFCLRGMLGQSQRKTLFKLFDIIKDICAEDVDVCSIDTLERRVHKVLALVERDFPVSIEVIVFHLLHHLPLFLKRYGPVYAFWMYPYERFNSWIIRRVLNRRYPESTVLETYRLTEWTNFMNLSGQLKEATVTLQAADLEDCHVIQETGHIRLAEEHMEFVRQYYIAKLPQFSELCDQYKMEKDKAKVYHQLKTFPAMSEWMPKHCTNLTANHREMCCGPSYDAVKILHFIYRDRHNRSVMLSSIESDHEHSYRRCSFVSSLDSTCKVGRITELFRHEFLSVTTTFAHVHWFDGPYVDVESKLSYVMGPAQVNSIVPVTSLSKPLIIGNDDDESDKLWILNYSP